MFGKKKEKVSLQDWADSVTKSISGAVENIGAIFDFLQQIVDANMKLEKELKCVTHRLEELENKNKPKLPMGITSIKDAEPQWEIIDVEEK